MFLIRVSILSLLARSSVRSFVRVAQDFNRTHSEHLGAGAEGGNRIDGNSGLETVEASPPNHGTSSEPVVDQGTTICCFPRDYRFNDRRSVGRPDGRRVGVGVVETGYIF